MFLQLPIDIQEQIFFQLCPKDRMHMVLSLPKSTPYAKINNIRKMEVISRFMTRNSDRFKDKTAKLSRDVIDFLIECRNDSYVAELTKDILLISSQTSAQKLLKDVVANSVSITTVYDIDDFAKISDIDFRYALAKCNIDTFNNLYLNPSTQPWIKDIFSDENRIRDLAFDTINHDNYEFFQLLLKKELKIDCQLDYKNVAIDHISQDYILKILTKYPKKLTCILNNIYLTVAVKQYLQELCEDNFYFDSAVVLYNCVMSHDLHLESSLADQLL